MDVEAGTAPNLMEMTADVVSAYVSKNTIPVGELPALISQVHTALTASVTGKPEGGSQKSEPAVPIKSSVKSGYIVCLEDGKKFKSLKRHLKSAFGMTPDEYRKKWGLSYDYPMVAPNYAAQRSELAKKMGLGNLRAASAIRAKSAAQSTSKKKGGRKKKA
jgi:predicted transcriptional regulator